MAESAVKSAKSTTKKCEKVGTNQLIAILDHQNTPTESMGTSPAQRIFSRRTTTLYITNQQKYTTTNRCGNHHGEERKGKSKATSP